MSKKGLEYIHGESKRLLDLSAAAGALALFSPVVLAGAAVSAVDTRTNPLFRQTRIGKNGLPFDLVKLRTMRGDPTENAADGTHGTYDPRASRAGHVLRCLSVDELPQSVNVLKGDMHAVGIRPLLEIELSLWEDADKKLFEDFVQAYEACPGWTGPDQLYRKRQKTCSEEVLRHSMRLGVEYVENATLLGDLKILAQTPLTVAHIISPYHSCQLVAA